MAVVLDLKSIRSAGGASKGSAVPPDPDESDPNEFERHQRTAAARAYNSSRSGWWSEQPMWLKATLAICAVLAVSLVVGFVVKGAGSSAAVKASGTVSSSTSTSGSKTEGDASADGDDATKEVSKPEKPKPIIPVVPEGKLANHAIEVKPGSVAFVTGSNSMIGSYVCRSLVERGYTVHAMVRFRSNLRNLGGILDHPNFKLVYGDLIDPYRMAELIKEANADNRLVAVHHYAAQAINGVSFGTPSLSTQVNVQGTLHLLEAIRALPKAIRESVRVLVAGSSTEYGRTADTYDKPMPEEAPFDPVTPYGVSKVATEYLARMYWNTYKIQTITARFFIQVAAGGTEHLALQEFSRQIAMIELGLQAPVLKHGNLETKRDMTDIADAAPVVVALAEMGVPGEGYNVCTGVAHKMSQLLSIAVGLAKVKIDVKYDDSRARPFDEKMMLGDPTKLIALTGWKPSVDMTKTTKQVLDYWRAEVEARYPIQNRKLVPGATPSAEAQVIYDRNAPPAATTTPVTEPTATTTPTDPAAAPAPAAIDAAAAIANPPN